MNNTAEILVVAVEVEVKSGAGLHWGGSSGVINLGMGGSLQPPIHHPIALKNSAKKAIKVMVSFQIASNNSNYCYFLKYYKVNEVLFL